jgi:hypothetical protein
MLNVCKAKKHTKGNINHIKIDLKCTFTIAITISAKDVEQYSNLATKVKQCALPKLQNYKFVSMNNRAP